MKKLITLTGCNGLFASALILFLQATAIAQSTPTFLNDISENEIEVTGQRYTFPKHYRTLHLDKNSAMQFFSNAPLESAASMKNSNVIFEMPMPDGSTSHFRIWETPVMHPDLAAQFPDIRTYAGQGIDEPNASIRLDMTPLGFHAMVLSPGGSVWIDPYCENTTSDYICYYKKDLPSAVNFVCETGARRSNVDDYRDLIPQNLYSQKVAGAQLRTYRLALACTGEYAATKGGTVAGAMAGIVTSINRVDGVYETEVAIRLTLIANNSSIVYTNSSTDPYTNGNGSTMLGQNQTTCTNVIGSANYDIGHVFSTGGGGVAYLGCVCSSSNKARGVTGSSNPVGDAYDIDYVAHEMGHQFGGNHTFNSTTGSCGGGNRSSSAAYEPGSGITIMAYAGICGADDLAAHSIAYFHTYSFDEIVNYSTTGNGNTCAAITTSGNTPPSVTSQGANYTIPISTPFVLTGAATDADGDPLTYSWEEMDLGTAGGLNVQSTTAPQFRPFSPVASPSRTFPNLTSIINNTASVGEWLPNQARSLKFRLTARDNKMGGGGVMHPDVNVTITVANTGGAFAVTAPNTAVTWSGGSSQNVTWNVSGTTGGGVNCANVKISLSTDGGNTFPTVLLASTANDGSESITVPNVASTTARIKVEGVGNIFFDMSNVNFTITAGSGLTAISTTSITPASYCAGDAKNISFTTTGTANAGNVFTAQLSNSSGSFVSPVAIGTLSGTSSGIIGASIPAGTVTGSGYRIRVVSSNPVVTGSDNGANLSITGQVAAAGVINAPFTSFCANIPVSFSVGAIANAATYNWSVSSPGIILSGQGTATVSVSFPPGQPDLNGTVSVYGSNGNCSGASSNLNIFVSSSPVATISGTTTFCSGSSTTLTAGPSGNAYQWSNGATTQSISVSTGATFSVTVTTPFSCNNSTGVTTTILSAPAPTISGTLSFCSGNSTVLNAGAGYSSYNWSTGATTQTISVSTSGTFSVTVTNANGCSGTTSVTTTLNSNPSPSISGSLSFCSGGSTTLNAGAGFSSYSWSTGATTQSISVSTAGTFSVTVTNANGCSGSTSATTTMSASLMPVITGSLTFCSGSSTTLNAGAGYSSYNWSTGATTQSIGVSTAGTFSVTVTNANGCSGSSSATTTINSNPSPSISGTLSFCSGSSTSLNAGAGFSSYNWSTGATTQSISVSTASTFSVTVTNSNGCSGSTSATTIVNALPSVSFSGLASSYNVSAPAVTLTGSPTGGSFSGPGISAATFSPASAGVGGPYSITYTYSDINGCSNTSSQLTNVTNCTAPAQPGSISVSGGSAKVCPGDVRTYTVASVSGATIYNWTSPTGANITGGAGTRIVTISFDNTFIVGGTLSVTAGNACGTGTARTLTISRNVPSTPGVIAGAATAVCAGSTGAYSVTNVSGIVYVWTAPANASIASGQGTNSVVVNFSSLFVTGSLSVKATNSCGTSGARAMTILSKPSTPAAISGSSSAVCANTVGTYSVTNVAGVTYNWTSPSNATIASGQGTNSVTLNFSASFTSGSLTVTGNNACGASAARTLTILSVPAVPGAITGSVYGNCNAINTYNISPVVNALSYTWSCTVPGSVVTPSGTSCTISFPSFTSGTVKVNSNNSCGGSATRNLTVNAAPVTPGTITGSALVCSGQQNVAYSIAPVATATAYTWTVPAGSTINDGVVTSSGNSLVTTASSVHINFGATAGSVSVKAKNACGSGGTRSLVTAFNCRAMNPDGSFGFTIYPNPAMDDAMVQFLSEKGTKYYIQLINMIGETVLARSGVAMEGSTVVNLNLTGLTKGVYTLRIIKGDKSAYNRFVVN